MGIRFISVLAMAAALAAPARADVDMGAYLAARAAMAETDFAAATPWLDAALRADPDSVALLMTTLAARVGTGDFAGALPAANRMVDMDAANELSAMVRLAGAAAAGDWAGYLAQLDTGESIGPMADALGRAWALVGTGEMTDALAAFDTVIATDGMLPFGLYHKALALALAGDFEGAEAILSLTPDQGMQPTRRALMARAQVLSQLGRNDDALTALQLAFPGTTDPAIAALTARLQAGDAVPFTLITGPAAGLAEAHYGLAAALATEVDELTVLFFARTALALDPAHTDAKLLTGQVLDQLGRFDLAGAVYGTVLPADPAFVTAELGRANALRRAGNRDGAVEVLRQLSRANPDDPSVNLQLGDLLRTGGDPAAAIIAYGAALDHLPAGDGRMWYVHYVRGIAHFQTENWPGAEGDFRAALAIRPDEPTVLNYLGYSLVERGEKLDEALDMIERAVAAAPQNGAIVDSLAWALYRLGRYAEAVPHMEQAAALLPSDPILNDHLGDVYWAVGRAREARFQWARALSFADDNPDLAATIRQKLDNGPGPLPVPELAEQGG